MMKRREAREKAVQSLFQLEGTELTIEEAMAYVLEEQETDAFFESVVMNEAIELSKTFGDDKTSKFVNGVLSKYQA